MDLWHTPSFAVYALFAVGLSFLLLAIDGLSGGFRVKSKTVVNREDASTVSNGAELVEHDPDGVARVMRAHRNALANIVPFLAVMFLYVALGASTTWVLALSGVFGVARLTHAAAYIGAKQPFRTASFVVGQLCTVVAMVQVLRAAFPLLA